MMATNGMVVEDLEMGVEYTFELRALGIGDLHGPSASITAMIADPDADPDPPEMPTGFTANDADDAGPAARKLVWNVVTGTSYETRYTVTDADEWTDWMMATNGMVVEDLEMGVEYTFELRAGIGDLNSPAASTTAMIADPDPDPDPPETPTGFTANDADDAGPAARKLVWNVVTGTSYETRYTVTDADEWTDWMMATNGMVVEDLEMGVEYTFELRAGIGDLNSPAASTMAMIAMPTPTLPEIALLLLAMLLLGSGVYLLRGRQSGGLTHA